MLHCIVTFDEKWQNWPTLAISYNIIRGTKKKSDYYYKVLSKFRLS